MKLLACRFALRLVPMCIALEYAALATEVSHGETHGHREQLLGRNGELGHSVQKASKIQASEVVAVEVAEDVEVEAVVEERKKRNGFPLPNLEGLLKMEKLNHYRKSISSHCLSK
jgi:hypothetical protein